MGAAGQRQRISNLVGEQRLDLLICSGGFNRKAALPLVREYMAKTVSPSSVHNVPNETTKG